MRYQAHVIVRAANDDPIAVIEIWNSPDLDCSGATEYRGNLALSDLLPDVLHFLIVSQERGFLWGPAERNVPNALPAGEFSMIPVMERYIPDFRSRERLPDHELEYILFLWLFDLMHPDASGESFSVDGAAGTALVGAIQGGRVLMDAAV